MFTPSVDAHKRKEVETRKSATKNRRTIKLAPSPPPPQEAEPKTIPPEARGKKVATPRAKKGNTPKGTPARTPKRPRHPSTGNATTTAATPAQQGSSKDKDKDDAASKLQFGNIRLVKSAKQVAEERDATIAAWQARAKAILDAIAQKEQQLIGTTTNAGGGQEEWGDDGSGLGALERRFAKHTMVSMMYCDAISAKLDLLTEMCGEAVR